MELFTDPANTQTIKLLVSAKLKGKDLNIKYTKHDEKVVPYLLNSKLPVLEYEEGQYFFSPNAATKYLLNQSHPPVEEEAIDQWLQWESSTLQPILQPALLASVGHGKVSESQQSQVESVLQRLDAALAGKQHVVGNSLSAADICLWAALYLPYKTKLKALDAAPNITIWFSRLQDQDAFSCATKFLENFNEVKASLIAQSVSASVTASTAQLLNSHSGPEAATPPVSNTPSQRGELSEPSEPSVSSAELQAAKDAWVSGHQKMAPPKQPKHPILPVAGEKNILITSALPYVNNVPHLGNIIGCVLSADVFARFCRLRNINTLYICGTDEYGTATETKALEEGVTPQQICDKYNKIHTQVYQWFNISFDYFGRTVTKQQTEIAQDIFWRLYKNDYIIKDSVDQLQCQKCDRFLADRFVEGICPFCAYEDARGDQCDKCGKLINAIELRNPRCKICGSSPVVKTSQHLFVDLNKLEPALVKHLDEQFEKGLWTNNAKVITKSWIRDGLKARCISRDLKWGTPVPLEGYTDKVFYVWFDAPIGYISITANYTDQWKKWWKNPEQVEMYNFLGKDNVPFHSVIFPACQIGADDGYTLVNHMSATEYLNYEDGKFSKSRGVGVFGSDAQETDIPADIWRFYLLYMRPEGQDSAFNWDDFVLKNNSELLNNLGNFVNRALKFVDSNFGGSIPEMVMKDEELELLALVNRELLGYINNLTKIKIRDGLRSILSISRLGNQYIQVQKPWVLVKGSEEEKKRAGTVVGLAANLACLLSVLLQPYMPEITQTIRSQLAAPAATCTIPDQMVCLLPAGHKIGTPKPVFDKLQPSYIEALKQKFSGKQSSEKEVPKETKQSEPVDGLIIAPASQEEIDMLSNEVNKQGDVVRQLKAAKAEKATIDEQVGKLMELKKQLALAQGIDPQTLTGGGKKKKKGKK